MSMRLWRSTLVASRMVHGRTPYCTQQHLPYT